MKNKSLILDLPAIWQTRGFVFLSLAVFIIPFSLGHWQFLTGSLVNACLFLSALVLSRKNSWPVIVLPSLAVLSRGLIFGPLTIFLVYLLPLIWLGNFVLVYLFGKFLPSLKFPLSILLASLGKALLLFSFTFLLFGFGILPKLFLTTMGVNQFITAVLGGFLAWVIYKFLNKNGTIKSGS